MFDSIVEYFALESKARAWERWHRIDRKVLTCACVAGVLNGCAMLVCIVVDLPLKYTGVGGWVVAGLMTVSIYTNWRATRAEQALHEGFKAFHEKRQQHAHP